MRSEAAGKRIQLMGMQDRTTVLETMRQSVGLVFPSECFESFPMVYAEAMAVGLPVLAWKPNAVSSLVQRQGTGVAISWANDLGVVLDRVTEHFASLRTRCRLAFETDLSEPAYVRRAESLYSELVGR